MGIKFESNQCESAAKTTVFKFEQNILRKTCFERCSFRRCELYKAINIPLKPAFAVKFVGPVYFHVHVWNLYQNFFILLGY